MRGASQLLALLALALPLSACSTPPKLAIFDDPRVAISFHYPAGWHVLPRQGWSDESVSPPRLAVLSFSLPGWSPEGDCTGTAAIARLPADGAIVFLLQEDGNWGPRPRRFSLRGVSLVRYECFGPSYRLAFRDHSRGFVAFVALGRAAGAPRVELALTILDSLRVAGPRPPAPAPS